MYLVKLGTLHSFRTDYNNTEGFKAVKSKEMQHFNLSSIF